jgi:peptide deformylase
MMQLVVNDIEALTKPLEKFNFGNPQAEPNKFAKDLVDAMYKYKGLGLSANQVGYPYTVFAMRGPEHDFVMFNPNIVAYSNETITLEEGCLSFPELFLKLPRAQHLRIRFADPNGDFSTHTFTGMTARIIQHEYSHMLGKLFFEGCNRYKLEKAIKQAKKKGHNYEGMGLLKYVRKE